MRGKEIGTAAALIYDPKGREVLEKIYRQYLQIAEDYSLPILMVANTRRATRENIECSQFKGKNVMSDYVYFLRELSSQYKCKSFIGCVMGCKGDAYTGEGALSIDEAMSFHEWQVDECAKVKVDYIFEAIMPALPEIIGLSKVIAERQMPYIVSFMVRDNGKLIDGHTIHEAITATDNALERNPLCYMVNCVHPDILRSALSKPFNDTSAVKARFMGIQANAACAAPEELDASQELKTSSADELVEGFMRLSEIQPMKIYGGCCGTDDTHIRRIAQFLRELKPSLKTINI